MVGAHDHSARRLGYDGARPLPSAGRGKKGDAPGTVEPEQRSFDNVTKRMTPDEYVDEVLALVERIPPGRVMAYGDIADYLAERSGRASARLVGLIMSRYGGAVPWHRVVTSNGRVVPHHTAEALQRLRADGTPIRNGYVDMKQAAWRPDSD